MLLTLWMYCSAIFYPVDRLEGPIRTVIELNPIYEYISATRSIVMYGGMPTVSDILKMMIWAVVMAGIGYYIFRINKNKVMQKI